MVSSQSSKVVLPNSAHYADFSQAHSAHHALRLTQTNQTICGMGIGEAVRKRRKELNLTLQGLCDRMDVEYDTGNLSKSERGVQNFSPKTLESVAKALGTTVAELYGLRDEAQEDSDTYSTNQLLEVMQKEWPADDIRAVIFRFCDELDPDDLLELASDLIQRALEQRDKN